MEEKCLTFSEPIAFAICATCAAVYRDLYDEEHREFILSDLKRLIEHVGLPNHVEDTIFTFCSGYGFESLPGFIEVLRKENNDDIIISLLHWASNNKNGYDARSRAVIEYICSRLDAKLSNYESNFAKSLKEKLQRQQKEEEEQKRTKRMSGKRIAMISAATFGGAAIAALTGGLAAPLVASGVGALFGTAAVGTATGIAVITTLFGAAGAGLAGYKMKRRVGGLEEFRFTPIRMGDSLHLSIAISGWTGSDNQGFTVPWKHLNLSTEQVSLIWESKYLKELGTALDRLIGTAVGAGVVEVLKLTALSGILAAFALPAAVLSATNLVDNPWSVCTKRAKEAGEELAHILSQRIHGKRPVSLIGCSSGALVIWHCLRELSRKGDIGQGIISGRFSQHAIILGAPITTNPNDWETVRSVVSGRIISGWTESDWVLGLLCHDNVAGTTRVNWRNTNDRRLVNLRLTGSISGHSDYQRKMTTILRLIGASQEDVKINKYYPSRNSDSPESPVIRNYSLKRSKSLSAIPVPRKRKTLLRRTKSINSVYFNRKVQTAVPNIDQLKI